RRKGEPSTVREQLAAVPLEPGARPCRARRECFDQPPKAGRVVHLDQMSHFVGDDIIEDRLRRKNQPPAEREVSGAGTASPTAFCVAHGDFDDLTADARGQLMRSLGELVCRVCREVATHPTREMHRIATYPDFTVAYHHARCDRIRLANDAM